LEKPEKVSHTFVIPAEAGIQLYFNLLILKEDILDPGPRIRHFRGRPRRGDDSVDFSLLAGN
jgi:hypothetical protein